MIQFRYRLARITSRFSRDGWRTSGTIETQPIGDWSEWQDATFTEFGLEFHIPRVAAETNNVIEVEYRDTDQIDDDSDAPWASDPEAWKRG